MAYDYDTVIIGGGPGGLAAAYGLNDRQHVAIVENNLWGGTCPNFGCDPKKILYGVVEHKRLAQNFSDKGIQSVPDIDWGKMMAFKRSYTDMVPGGTKSGLKASNIDAIEGSATFSDAHTITVAGRQITADNFVIATGAFPARLDIPGKELFETSNDFLDQRVQPKQIAIVGAGYVATEIANIAVTAGVKVDLYQHNDRILRDYPEAFTKKLVAILSAKGVNFHWNTNVTRLAQADRGVELTTNQGDDVIYEHVYTAVGRPANTTDLKLCAAGVNTDRRGAIQVDEHMRSSAPNIYAVGDVVSSAMPKLTPVASFTGRYVAGAILGDDATISLPPIPHTVFAGPELGKVGVSLDDAAAQPEHFTVSTQQVGSWYTYMRLADKDAMVATVTDKKSGQLVGATVLATNAEELVNYFTEIIADQKPASMLGKHIMVYPSVASDLGYFYN
ncbi:NAD(P)/FAD-dependent oxidoreductase [Lacticaseibacillus pabuli]|uniref:NAD(P)/FAD-dependent oxidoreductase n=1 Tax=Lacticaseibacillus pabuli TaxID=3025672 RepID=A0ABY7WTB3_9LACO|nr:NAD(P)/FAD-dependent oxidoreductase [Lacticaseibacillus sp. KACC 23028]WDF83356.1 NAD(P)/FAD-dependent oxidoreductase [Lacticaseibacillus sp. KACC 23028]